MRSVSKRPGAFAILVPSPGFLLLEAFLLWQSLAAVGEAGEALAWVTLAFVVALLGLMLRLGDWVERRP